MGTQPQSVCCYREFKTFSPQFWLLLALKWRQIHSGGWEWHGYGGSGACLVPRGQQRIPERGPSRCGLSLVAGYEDGGRVVV